MDALCEFIAGRTDVVRRSPDVILILDALNTDAGERMGSFTLFVRDEQNKSGWRQRAPAAEALKVGASSEDLPSAVVVVGAAFERWNELLALAERAGVGEVTDIVVLVPTGSDAMSQASLAQFATEVSLRARAFGLPGDMRIAAQCDAGQFGTLALQRQSPSTLLGKFLSDLVADVGGVVALLVLSGPPGKLIRDAGAEPLFTVLTRTQGARMETLREVLLCLSAQTIDDFEHLIIAHNASADAVREIGELIDGQSQSMRQRIRFEEVAGGTRTTPLNVGFGAAKGKYVIILDDDDIVFANWLETFRALAREKPGTLLRAVAVRQEYVWATVRGNRAARAVGAMHRDYAPQFDYLAHLEVSQTPPVSIAFPRYLFAEHGLRFDETLTTTEDWDYIMRCASRVGVASSEEITCIYRWWVDAENSRTVHSQSEWTDNHERIQNKIDQSVNLLEEGTTRRYRDIDSKMNEYLRWANKLHHDLQGIQAAMGATDSEQLKQNILALSRSVEGELSAILHDAPASTMPLMLPQEDMLPPPQLSAWQKLFATPATVARMRAKLRRDAVEASGIFDADWYCSTYPDVAMQGIDPLTHFVRFGSRELRSPSAQFNARSYYVANPDLREQRIEPVFHFVLHGRREGRRYDGH